MVSAYLETLGLEKKIADRAIKGGSYIRVDIKAPENSMKDICITKEDETTGYKFSKIWSEFYDLLVEKISIEGVIRCRLDVNQDWEKHRITGKKIYKGPISCSLFIDW